MSAEYKSLTEIKADVKEMERFWYKEAGNNMGEIYAGCVQFLEMVKELPEDIAICVFKSVSENTISNIFFCLSMMPITSKFGHTKEVMECLTKRMTRSKLVPDSVKESMVITRDTEGQTVH